MGTTWPGVREEGGIHDLRKETLGSLSGKIRQQEEEKMKLIVGGEKEDKPQTCLLVPNSSVPAWDTVGGGSKKHLFCTTNQTLKLGCSRVEA